MYINFWKKKNKTSIQFQILWSILLIEDVTCYSLQLQKFFVKIEYFQLDIQKIRLFNIVMTYCYNFAVKINRLGFSRILPSRNGIQCQSCLKVLQRARTFIRFSGKDEFFFIDINTVDYIKLLLLTCVSFNCNLTILSSVHLKSYNCN